MLVWIAIALLAVAVAISLRMGYLNRVWQRRRFPDGCDLTSAGRPFE